MYVYVHPGSPSEPRSRSAELALRPVRELMLIIIILLSLLLLSSSSSSNHIIWNFGGFDSGGVLFTRDGLPPELAGFPKKSRLWILSPVGSYCVICLRGFLTTSSPSRRRTRSASAASTRSGGREREREGEGERGREWELRRGRGRPG